ncbi:MAG: hypothetical protein AB8H12_16225 [Lewinella sp.]
MKIHSRIYCGGAFAFGEQQAVDTLLAGGYSGVIVWSVHVNPQGNLILNNTPFVTNGVYQEQETMNLPVRIAQLHQAGVDIIFSVGAGGTHDFTNIGSLVANGVPGPGSLLYDNFLALKTAMVAAGGDIDAIDFDNEDNMDTKTMVNFGLMLGNIGYGSVTLCPYYQSQVWTDTYNQLLTQKGSGFVSAIHLQCYSGGQGNSPQPWGAMIAQAVGNTALIPGLATTQAEPGPWWDGGTNSQGGSVVKTPNVAMYGKADWSLMLRKDNYVNANDAMQSCSGAETFFFYCRGPMDLGPGKVFKQGDAVFFGGRPQFGSAPQADSYSLSGGCSDIYNGIGACPANLQAQYRSWKGEANPPNGGFIWMYDSILNCLLSDCCGEAGDSAGQVAKAYQQAIVQGLS